MHCTMSIGHISLFQAQPSVSILGVSRIRFNDELGCTTSKNQRGRSVASIRSKNLTRARAHNHRLDCRTQGCELG